MSESTQTFVDGTARICRAIEGVGIRLQKAITPPLAGSRDEAGGHVESLTEAVMGMTSALVGIAAALDNIADAVSHVARAMQRQDATDR